MIVVLEKNISEKQLNNIIKHLEDFGFAIHKSAGEEKVIIGAIGVQPNFDTRKVKILDGVEEVYRITEPFKLASRSFKKDDTVINIKNKLIGGNEVNVIAGPCSCLLYTSDAADERSSVDLGGRRIIKKKKKKNIS